MSANATQQATLVSQATVKKDTGLGRIALFAADGSPLVVLTKDRVTTVNAVTATNATAAAGATPTKAEYDALVTLANANKAQLNSLLSALKA